MVKTKLTMTIGTLPLCEFGTLEEWGEHLSGYTFGVYTGKTLIATCHTLPDARAFARRYTRDNRVATVVKDMANGAQYFHFE
jgi:uncharacterized membrane protein YadS